MVILESQSHPIGMRIQDLPISQIKIRAVSDRCETSPDSSPQSNGRGLSTRSW